MPVNTTIPLLELHALEQAVGTKAKIFGKLEFFNPSGSVKDRIAYSMITAKEEAGDLKPGGTIIEGTSGNTGIQALAVEANDGLAATTYGNIVVTSKAKEKDAALATLVEVLQSEKIKTFINSTYDGAVVPLN